MYEIAVENEYADLESTIETTRTKVNTPNATMRILELEEKRRQKQWKELITLKCVDDDGQVPSECTWEIERLNLTAEIIKSISSRCPLNVSAVHLLEVPTAEVITLDDAQVLCKSLPWEYVIISKEKRDVVDDATNLHYKGSTRLMLLGTPLRTDNQIFKVTTDDLRIWLLYGLMEDNDELNAALMLVKELTVQMEVFDKQLSRVSSVNKGTTEKQKKRAREYFYDSIVTKKDEVATCLQAAKETIMRIHQDHENINISFEQGLVNETLGSCSYYITFEGQMGKKYEKAALYKQDWLGIKLSVGNGPTKAWAGRSKFPDDLIQFELNCTPLQVNMRTVQLCRLSHGFGQYTVVPRNLDIESISNFFETAFFYPSNPVSFALSASANASTKRNGFLVDEVEDSVKVDKFYHELPFAGDKFSFYVGQFFEGKKTGLGTLYSERGILRGKFENGTLRGEGFEHRADGTRISGLYGVQSDCAISKLNPYAVGVLNGHVNVDFADGAKYVGEMKNGKICGGGVYTEPNGKLIKGTFFDGLLDNNKGKCVNSEGKIQKGYWKNGVLHGAGGFELATSQQYYGDWHYGQKSGKGALTLPDKSHYHGYFCSNERSGLGTLYRGNVKKVPENLNFGGEILANRKYRGVFAPKRLVQNGRVYLTRTGKTCLVSGNVKGIYSCGLNRTNVLEQSVSKSSAERDGFLENLEFRIRELVENEKKRLSEEQTCLAIMTLVRDFVEPFTESLDIDNQSGIAEEDKKDFDDVIVQEGGSTKYDANNLISDSNENFMFCTPVGLLICKYFEEMQNLHHRLPVEDIRQAIIKENA